MAKELFMRPLLWYNDVLIRYPLLTKSVTSGFMYAGGDVIAQYTETYVKNRGKTNPDELETTKIDKKRVLRFFLFGTIISGPAMHYWFNYLNELPALMWQYKQIHHRGKILRAYAYLKSHGIEANLDLAKLPNAKALTKWKGKAGKIAADQLIFSPIYTLIFFLIIGMMEGGTERVEGWFDRLASGESVRDILDGRKEQEEKENKSLEGLLSSSQDAHIMEIIKQLKKKVTEEQHRASSSTHSHKHRATGDSSSSDEQDPQSEIHHKHNNHHHATEKETLVQELIRLIKETPNHASSPVPVSSSEKKENEKSSTVIIPPSWAAIWDRTWKHCKEVYLPTYLADVTVWPPLQLINFTYVPVRFQFLFVNTANLAWNTFLSMMANKHHGGGGGGGGDISSEKKKEEVVSDNKEER
jgi:hypothetical protein